MKILALILTLFTMTGCKSVTTTIATCDNGFTKESESLLIDKDILRWGYPLSVYKIADGVTCTITQRELDNESNR